MTQKFYFCFSHICDLVFGAFEEFLPCLCHYFDFISLILNAINVYFFCVICFTLTFLKLLIPWVYSVTLPSAELIKISYLGSNS